jgi:hypothetical protein
MNASDKITKSIACPLDTVDRTMDTDDNNEHATSTGKYLFDDEKENVVKRLGSNANDVKLKINRAITAGKTSSQITIGKVEMSPTCCDMSARHDMLLQFGQMGPCRRHDIEDVMAVCVGLSQHLPDFPKCVCRNILWYGSTYAQILSHPHALNAHFMVLLLPPRSCIR